LCISSAVTNERHHAPDAKLLSEKWDCGIKTARTLGLQWPR
jgi:hypothetical protein